MLRVSETYLSYQGEGPTIGRPTIFVRFAGCNLKCPGWPCDTQHAIDPKIFSKEATRHDDPLQLSAEIRTLWKEGFDICFTGGEVLLQPAHDLELLLDDLQAHTGSVFVLFTNGTFRLGRVFRNWFSHVILDWKLPGSGETLSTQQELNVLQNLKDVGPQDAIKFTLADLDGDFEDAKYRYENIITHLRKPPTVYVGAVWGKVKEADLAAKILGEGLPWHLNVQLHKYIWDPDARRT
jgi:7-carboxy-7-deazaguanine synthase